MARGDILFDNPVLVKHLRSRLRPGQMFPWLGMVLVVSLCILLSGQYFGTYSNGTALSLILGLEVLILVFIGGQQVGSAVSGARESGILDFHRVSPQPPSWLALGFFLGAPVREYLFFLATMPFAVFIAWLSPGGAAVLLQLWVGLLLIAWVVHAIALLGGLVGKRPKGTPRGSLVGFIFLGLFLIQPIGAGIYFAATRLGAYQTIRFFGVSVLWMPFVVVYLGVLLGMLLLAAARKMRSESAHAYTKAEAVGVMGIAAVLLLGAFWGYPQAEYLVLVMIYTLTFLGCLLIAAVTPTQAEYVRGLRRALRRDRRRPSPWSDEGTNQLATTLICAVVFLGPTILWEVLVRRGAGGPPINALTIAIGVFVAAYFGFGFQFFLLRLPKFGANYMSMFLLLVWLIPVVVGSISLGATNNQGLGQVILALSPLAGIAMSSGLIDEPIAEAARFAAIGPAIGFAFLFGFFLTNVQRRLDRAVKTAAGLIRKPAGPFDYLDAPSVEVKAAPTIAGDRLPTPTPADGRA